MAKTDNHTHSHDPAKCEFCSHFHEFDLPSHLMEEFLAGRVVLFAGAGISTEGKHILPFTLYDDVRQELDISEDIPFSELMSRFCTLPNGRAELLRKIRERFEYVHSFPHIYGLATRFHRELSTLFLIESIVTTNWDDYFERECGAIPFVTAEDFTFWITPGRKVFKIHGSINNLGSIVATSEDYEKCYHHLQQGVLGSSLKMMLATKTILYMGYSFRDEDFLRLHSLLKDEMGEMLPHGYIVTLDRTGEERFRELGLTPIFTDAAYFISILKRHIIEEGHMLDDEVFDKVRVALKKAVDEHIYLTHKFNFEENPDVLYTAFYQDGLLQSFRRMLAISNTGNYSHTCYVHQSIETYEGIRRDMLKVKRYADVAYIDGYMNGMYFLLADDKERKMLPYYYVFGAKDQPISFQKFNRLRRNASTLHKSAYRYAQRLTKGMGSMMVPQHMPYFV